MEKSTETSTSPLVVGIANITQKKIQMSRNSCAATFNATHYPFPHVPGEPATLTLTSP